MIGECLRWVDEYIVECLLHWQRASFECDCGCKEVWVMPVGDCGTLAFVGCVGHGVVMFDLPALTHHFMN